MDKENQNKKHVVSDSTKQKQMEGNTHTPDKKNNSQDWLQKLKDLFG